MSWREVKVWLEIDHDSKIANIYWAQGTVLNKDFTQVIPFIFHKKLCFGYDSYPHGTDEESKVQGG